MSIVRLATPADGQELWRLTLLAHKENALRSLAPERIQWWMNRILCPELIPAWDTGPRGVIGVIGSEGSLEGMAFLIIGQFWYSGEKHLEELIVYADPAHRKAGRVVTALVNWMKEQSEATKLPLLTGIMSTDRTEAKVRLYQRLLGKPIGAFFFVNPKGSAMPPALATAMSS